MPSAADVDAVPVTAVGLLAGETNRGDWSGATAYAVGDVVHDHAEGQVYVCTAANTNEQPSLTPAKWTAIDGTGRTLALGPGGSAGLFAASLGYGAEAGAGATAIGYAVSAPGFAATAVGCTATAAGAAATAAGSTAAAGGDSSTAVGANATSPGDYSTAIGYGATAPTDGDVNIANILTGHIDTGTGQADEAITVVPGAIDLPETADATNPAAGVQRLVARTDGVYVRDEAGTEVGPLGAGGSGIPATIIDAAGDLIVGTAADTAARLAVGTSGQVLTSNGTTAAWAAPSSTPAEVFIPATTLHGSTNVQSNWSTYPTRAHAFHQLNDSATSTVGAMVGKSIPWTSVDIYAVLGNPSAGTGDVRWTLYYGKDAGTATTRSSVSTTTTLAAGGVTYPTPQRVKVGNAIAWDTAGEWSLVLSRLGSDGADTLATAIFLQGLVIRQAGT